MNCIIVDDEPLGREAIRLLVDETPELTLSGSFSDAQSAGEFLASHPVDVVFLDIRMPGVDGIAFAETIKENTLIVFTTAYPEYAVESYDLDAVDYLLKPVEPARFKKAITKVADYLKLLRDSSRSENTVETVAADHLFVKADRRYFKIMLADILFVEGLKDYVIIHTADRRIVTNSTLKAMQERLPAEIFLRTNKSYIVNLEKIDSFDSNDIFISTHELSIGDRYREEFLRRVFNRD